MVIMSLLILSLLLALRSGVHALILRGLRAPRLASQRSPADVGLQAQPVWLPVADGKTLFAWFMAAPGIVPAPAVVVMHGWGANASLMWPMVAPLHVAGCAALLLDARCHGASSNEQFTSLPRFAEDIEAGLDWLSLQANVDSTRLAAIGHSVGAGAALLCATRRHDLRAVVSISAFAHPREVMRRLLGGYHIPHLVLGWYVLHHVQRVIGARFDEIAPVHSIAHARCPVLLVHGTHDQTVPFEDARRLQAAGAPETKCIAVAGGHDLSHVLDEPLQQVIEFLHDSFAQAPQGGS